MPLALIVIIPWLWHVCLCRNCIVVIKHVLQMNSFRLKLTRLNDPCQWELLLFAGYSFKEKQTAERNRPMCSRCIYRFVCICAGFIEITIIIIIIIISCFPREYENTLLMSIFLFCFYHSCQSFVSYHHLSYWSTHINISKCLESIFTWCKSFSKQKHFDLLSESGKKKKWNEYRKQTRMTAVIEMKKYKW